MRARVWVPCLLATAIIASAVLVGLPREEAQASFTSKSTQDLVKYVKGDAAFNLRLCALNALLRKTDSGVEGELEKLAKGGETKLAIFATTALGRKKTTAAKTKLKALVEKSTLDTKIRKSAMTAIAVHWKSRDDLTYLDLKSSGNTDLRPHYLYLKTYIYRR